MEKTAPLYSKIDESFTENNSLNYELTFQVTERSCAYSVFDHDKNRYIAVESFGISLPDVFGQNQWLRNSFKSVRIIVENNRSTLIPSALFEESEKETYLNFSLKKDEDERVFHDKLSEIEVVNIYGFNENLYDELAGFFHGAKVCHLSSALIESIWMNFKNLITNKRIFIFVREEAFNLLIFEKKQLVYSNAFYFHVPEDFVYFVIFVMEQLDLNPEEVPVTLLGKIDTDSPHFELIFRYIRNIDFAARSETSGYSYVFNDVPGHFYYPLLNPWLCGS